MLPDDRDAGYLWDMLDAARAVEEFTSPVKFGQYLQDRKLRMAVERAVEIIGEAARRVSDGFRSAHPEIPWKKIVGQRNVLAHEYGEIRHERMWVLATTDIPDLIAKLTPLVPSPPSDADAAPD
jgi:uncharacterized protein with HEPN domain